VTTLIGNLAAFWNLLLLIVVVATLLWFFYSIYVRRIWRARRIAHARERRMLREAAERESNKAR
jgi:hypothetical protein